MNSIRPNTNSLPDILIRQEKRTRALESSQRLGYSSIVNGGAIEVLDNTGTVRLRIGTKLDGSWGIEELVNGVWVNAGYSDTGWTNLTLNAFFTLGTDGARYRVLNGVCHFQLIVTAGSAWSAGQQVTIFPAGARPAFTHYYQGDFGGTVVPELTVTSDGQLRVSFAGSGGIATSGSFPVG